MCSKYKRGTFFHLASIAFVSLTSPNTYASFKLIFPANIERYIFYDSASSTGHPENYMSTIGILCSSPCHTLALL